MSVGLKAKEYRLGQKVTGEDGKMYQVAKKVNGVKYWKPVKEYKRSTCRSLTKPKCSYDPNCAWRSGKKSKSGRRVSGKCLARKNVRKGKVYSGPMLPL